ncbi:nucleotidyltransferase domain-containing protein [Virgibacillus sp. SK37]|uniref:nucleotidyltransferase domain-containing protein n=1 Tax=Virgibacillus sp. SK37 TaxID=403957 RepID=UPI0004D0CF8A|nr:nucleotidyltransferase domain-containing protein [Virgibacillus sp. SK37]AIF43021.1 nucleotidyltransferase [Virgibacillus sp. SK37]
MTKLDARKAAQQIVEKNYPNCKGALLAGSVVRGQATNTSDLDIVIFSEDTYFSYRESFIELEWPVEAFVHNFSSYKHFFVSDKERAIPTLLRMVAEGIVLKEDTRLHRIKQEANELLEAGPEKWTSEMINIKRYFITDMLDDFIGSSTRGEDIVIAGALAERISEFALRTNERWLGSSKWIIRSLKQYDEAFAAAFIEAFDLFYKKGEKEPVIQLVDAMLYPYGGRLFDGFSIGKL